MTAKNIFECGEEISFINLIFGGDEINEMLGNWKMLKGGISSEYTSIS